MEALALAKENKDHIDLVLTDVVMPHMSGKELVKQVTELSSKIKTIYMSGYTDNAIVKNGILEPDTVFLQKPFSPKLLLQKVREVLDSL